MTHHETQVTAVQRSLCGGQDARVQSLSKPNHGRSQQAATAALLTPETHRVRTNTTEEEEAERVVPRKLLHWDLGVLCSWFWSSAGTHLNVTPSDQALVSLVFNGKTDPYLLLGNGREPAGSTEPDRTESSPFAPQSGTDGAPVIGLLVTAGHAARSEQTACVKTQQQQTR